MMDVILKSNKYDEQKIKTINQCRLYLQAVTIANIANPAGTWLDKNMLKGNMTQESSTFTGVKMNQERPTDRAWKIWEGANRLWANKHGKLDNPLVQWTTPIH